jgi:hypothetical protein
MLPNNPLAVWFRQAIPLSFQILAHQEEMRRLNAFIEERTVQYDNDQLNDDQVKEFFMEIGSVWSLRRDLAKMVAGK